MSATWEPEPHGFATAQVHAGASPDGDHGARIPPIHLTAGFVFEDFDTARDRFAGEADGYTYTRMGNPTVEAVERRIQVLEGGLGALLVASGQAAVTTALLALAGSGDHLVVSSAIYEGTRGLVRDDLGRLGIAVDFIDDPLDLAAWRAAIRPETRALFTESIANPGTDLVDTGAIAALGREHGVPLVVDSTFATPYLFRPAEHGAAVVVHSASKFLAGHGAALGGVVVDGGFDYPAERFPHLHAPHPSLGGDSFAGRYGRQALGAYARGVVAPRFGPVLSPLSAFVIQLGIETLSLRMARQTASALALATWLAEQPAVERVDHAALPGSRHLELARRDFPRGVGAVFSFTVRGGEPAARAVLGAVRLASHMTHVGDVRTLLLHPATTSHAQRTPEERRAGGVEDGTLRISVGIEELEDLRADLGRALDAATAATSPDRERESAAAAVA
ncbi:O-acetylhomoserine aminocarboxypropyltransferase/cysteine synthase family protein [Homoserinibacter sp. YIM 151385]|uniref:O-acetylhomoserine aminocarboxypropyltransferase/cysteine synthase family protein n=1 Tax=Homoserinibacter sp. YIM 151385 TaxID=2985506 RepID=UPI0022EFE2DA|nr:PLP-dependent transferase [Homoserinibacter sp. YIM 151385]WBU38217.1 aminotransferase class I/II-fold pyridoxal phosphate-dependent enzyme [Homoserinibacter sp. YIM 151385]